MVGHRLVALAVAASVWVAGLPGAFLATGIPQVRAAEPASRLAILPLAVDGEISESDRQDLTRALVAGFQRGSFDVIAPADVADKSPEAAGCADAACVVAVAGKTGASYVARPTVKVADRDYAIKVELLDGKTGQRIAQSEDACEICGVVDASGLLGSAAASLGAKLESMAKGPATLVLKAEPSGAVITLDGELLGTAPLERPIPPGKHVLRVSQDGYIPTEREVTFVEGVREELSFTLERMPSALPGKGVGFASLGVGIAALGATGFLLWLDNNPYKIGGSCSTFDGADPNAMYDPQGNVVCKELWDTTYGVAAAGIAGAALTTLGVLVLIDTFKRSDRSKQKAAKSSKRSARFGVGPGSVMVRGRF